MHLPYRYLGKSGLKVSTLCLGAMTFGQQEVSSGTLRCVGRRVYARYGWMMDDVSNLRELICAVNGRVLKHVGVL